MNITELERALRLGGMADVLETRLHQAQAEPMAPIDLIASMVSDELLVCLRPPHHPRDRQEKNPQIFFTTRDGKTRVNILVLW